MNPIYALECAASFAALTGDDDRNFRHGAMGIRADGVKVFARNSASEMPNPDAHAEARLARKLGGGIVYVARITQANEWALSRPCLPCLLKLRSRGVSKIYYTLAPDEYGVLDANAYGIRALAYRRCRRA